MKRCNTCVRCKRVLNLIGEILSSNWINIKYPQRLDAKVLKVTYKREEHVLYNFKF
jgi:hypothetical protein